MADDDQAVRDPDPQADTCAILDRRGTLRARASKHRHWRKLIAAGAAAGAVGAMACSQVQVCLMPPPSYECPSGEPGSNRLRQAVQAQVGWQPDGDGWRLAVQLEIHLPGGSGDAHPIFTEPAQVVDATLITEFFEHSGLDFTCVPVAGASTVRVLVAMTCNGHSETLHFALDVSGVRGSNASVPLTWID